MSPATTGSETVREAFLAREDGAGEGCPPIEAIWQAAHGERLPEETRDIVHHTSACPACAAAWRLAVDARPLEAAKEATPSSSAWATSWRLWVPAAAAAVLAVSVLVYYRTPQGHPEVPAYRAQKPSAAKSLVADGGALPRGAFTLRWSAGPEGSRYRIRVTDEDLKPLAATRVLDGAEYTVPADDLKTVPAGGKVLWQVVVIAPGGREAASETFTNRVE